MQQMGQALLRCLLALLRFRVVAEQRDSWMCVSQLEQWPLTPQALVKTCRCPLTFQLMGAPLMSADCVTYEGKVIEEWLNVRGTSPISRVPMTPPMLRINRLAVAVTELIFKWWPDLSKAAFPSEEYQHTRACA